jgi:hypothetical protein
MRRTISAAASYKGFITDCSIQISILVVHWSLDGFPFREPELPGCKYRERSRSGQGQVNILMSSRIHRVSHRTQHIICSEPVPSLVDAYQVRMLTCDAIVSSVLERVSELYTKRRGRLSQVRYTFTIHSLKVCWKEVERTWEKCAI